MSKTPSRSRRSSREHHRHHRRRSSRFAKLVGRIVAGVRDRPARAALSTGLASALIGLVATTTLPLAVARRAPELALRLDGTNAEALVTLALRRHDDILSLLPPIPSTSGDKSTPSAKDDRDMSVEARTERAETIARLRAEMSDLAARAIAANPLEATAYRLAAEAAKEPTEIRRLMTEAFARSRHESAAVFWLLNAAYERGDVKDVVEKADVLLRTRRELARYTLSYLYSITNSPEGRAALVETLTRDPSWRSVFFSSGEIASAESDDMLQLFLSMKAAGSPAAPEEIAPFLENRLYKIKDVEGVYNTWLQLLSERELAELRPVNNLDFALDPNGTPFDWRFPKRTNVSLTLSKEPNAENGERSLGVHFPIGRIVFGGVEQVVFLHPGNYRFEGQQTGRLAAKRGMRWSVVCFGTNDTLSSSDQLLGQARGWQVFAFDFTVPDDGSCNAQRLRLVHDSRSPSEEYATGDLSFRKLVLTRLPDTD